MVTGIRKVLLDIWNGERDMDVTLNGRTAWVNKLKNGSMEVENHRQRVLVMGNKYQAIENEDGSIEGTVWWSSFRYLIKCTPHRDEVETTEQQDNETNNKTTNNETKCEA